MDRRYGRLVPRFLGNDQDWVYHDEFDDTVARLPHALTTVSARLSLVMPSCLQAVVLVEDLHTAQQLHAHSRRMTQLAICTVQKTWCSDTMLGGS